MFTDVERDKEGKFIESPDSLHPRTIGLRLPKRLWPKFEAEAERRGLTLAELSRAIIVESLEGDRTND